MVNNWTVYSTLLSFYQMIFQSNLGIIFCYCCCFMELFCFCFGERLVNLWLDRMVSFLLQLCLVLSERSRPEVGWVSTQFPLIFVEYNNKSNYKIIVYCERQKYELLLHYHQGCHLRLVASYFPLLIWADPWLLK